MNRSELGGTIDAVIFASLMGPDVAEEMLEAKPTGTFNLPEILKAMGQRRKAERRATTPAGTGGVGRTFLGRRK